MDDKKIYKIVNEEITKALIKESGKSGGIIGNLISKFYMFIIKNDLEAAKKALQENPELLQAAEDIKNQSEVIAKDLLKNKEFLKFLFNIQDKK